MSTFIGYISVIVPLLLISVCCILFNRSQKKEKIDEEEYMSKLSESEKNQFLKEKNKALLDQQKVYSVGGVATTKRV